MLATSSSLVILGVRVTFRAHGFHFRSYSLNFTLLPGHATLNEHPSIGFAMEFVDKRISINLGAPNIQREWYEDISINNPAYDPRNVPRKIQTKAFEKLAYHGMTSDLR